MIHRDLKPANIKVTPEDKVKVLDFGLAKAFAGEQADLNLSNSPTLSVAATQQGVILGTAAYMSPEQARGKEVDKRADIWAFGVVLFEMLTGKQVFTGDTVSDILATVITKEPDWESIPGKLKPLLRHCLEKDISKRLKDIGDIHILLETKPELVQARQQSLTWSIGAILLFILILGIFYIFLREKPADPVPKISEIVLPDGIRYIPQSSFSLSPDENSVAASVPLISNSEYTDVWILDLLGNRPWRFTLGEGHNSRPVWSHDGSDILFIWNREGQYDIYRKSLNGADKEELVYQSDEDKYPTSCAGEFLLFTTFNEEGDSDLWILPLQDPDSAHVLLSTKYNEGDGHFSPDRRWIAYTSDKSGRNEVYVQSFSTEGAGSWASGIFTISDNGGQGARWRKDGKELYYRTVDGMVMAVEVSGSTEFRARTPQKLFQGPIEQITTSSRAPFPVWDVTKDGEKFLIPASDSEGSKTAFTMIVNWSALLKE